MRLSNIHPGEVLLEEFLKPLSLSGRALASDIGVSAARIHRLVRREQRITADTAKRLARRLGASEHFWGTLQAAYDVEAAGRRR